MPDTTLPAVPAHIHFMGLGGIGVSALARILLERGYEVSGCDLTLSRLTDDLVAHGATALQGHDDAHLDGVDVVVISAAVRAENPELRAAHQRAIPVVKRAELLAMLLRDLRTIGVAGTHGKTTTSGLLATMLIEAGFDPTAFVGGEVFGLDGEGAANARAGRGEWAVAEADEYDASFLRLSPEIAVVTNVEADHLDYYGNLDGIRRAFAAFVSRLPRHGVLVLCADDAEAMRLAADAPCRVITYGLTAMADWTASEIQLDERGARFTVRTPQVTLLHVATPLGGRHNLANALGALVAATLAGVEPEVAVRTLRRFRPPKRRQESKGYAAGGALVVDDYAHHPTEIRATLAGLRLRYPGRRLRVAYQPHTYSRTRAFLAETGASFADADEVAIAEIYAARESDTLGVSGGDVARAAREAGARATCTPTLDAVRAWLASDDSADVVLVTMGAGDIWRAGEALVATAADVEGAVSCRAIDDA